MDNKIKISAVSYSNTLPFVYGLLHSDIVSEIDLSLDVPAECADRLIRKDVDIGLIPIIEIKKVPDANIISDYCIGADGPVRTVVLTSDVPLHSIKRIYLDYQSRTSITLARILAKNYWKIEPEWIMGDTDFEKRVVKGNSAAVVIGDRTFAMENRFLFHYDLSSEWKNFTGKPFVFACWVSNTRLSSAFLNHFNKALLAGINSIPQATQLAGNNSLVSSIDLNNYLTRSLSYHLDKRKQEGMKQFLDLAEEFIAVKK